MSVFTKTIIGIGYRNPKMKEFRRYLWPFYKIPKCNGQPERRTDIKNFDAKSRTCGRRNQWLILTIFCMGLYYGRRHNHDVYLSVCLCVPSVKFLNILRGFGGVGDKLWASPLIRVVVLTAAIYPTICIVNCHCSDLSAWTPAYRTVRWTRRQCIARCARLLLDFCRYSLRLHTEWRIAGLSCLWLLCRYRDGLPTLTNSCKPTKSNYIDGDKTSVTV